MIFRLHNRTSMPTNTPYLGTLLLLTSLFFIWGFITCLNDILIPHLKAVFTLNYTQAMLVQFCFFAAYFIMSVPSGYFVQKFSYQSGIVVGLGIASAGCLLFYPAASLVSYPLFLFAFFVLASGITLLQVAANPYVSLLGAPASAPRRLTLTQAFNSLGTTLAPYVGSLFILATTVKSEAEMKLLDSASLTSYHAAQANGVQTPYLLLAFSLLTLAVIFALIQLPDVVPEALTGDEHTDFANIASSAWHYRHLRLGALAIFVYVGAEVAIGSFLVSYLSAPDIGNLTPASAGQYVAWYWGGAMCGRFFGASLMQRIPAAKLLAGHALTALLLLLITIFSSGSLAMWSVIAIGLCNSIMFPTIFSLALQKLGRHTAQASGILCAAIVGGAIVPLLQGMCADRLGVQAAFFLPILCYSYIAYYGWRGSRI